MTKLVRSLAILTLAFSVAAGGKAESASLRVSPILVEIAAPAQASTLTLRNESDRPLNAQVRIMRWTQKDGVESLEPSTDVVASPPIVKLLSNIDFTVRIVRVATTPISGEESYRILVDEIPEIPASRPNTVAFVLRYSIPVFFTAAADRDPIIQWSIRSSRGKFFLMATNTGSRRLRLANVKIADADGKLVLRHDGLLGYVLPGSTMQWPFAASEKDQRMHGLIKLVADGETRPIHATIALQARQ